MERQRLSEGHSLPEDHRGRTCQETKIKLSSEGYSPTGDRRGTCQDTERKRPSEAHSLPRDRRVALVKTRKEGDRTSCTHQLETGEGEISQDTDRMDSTRDTHQLETAERGTCEDTEIKSPSEGHSLSEDRRGRDCQNKATPSEWHSPTGVREGRNLSGHRKEVTQRGALTNSRPQREGLIRAVKESDRVRNIEEYSPTRDRREWNLSGQ